MLSIVIPTLGRRTLKRTLESIFPELGPSDEVLVVGDGHRPQAQATVEMMDDARFSYHETPLAGNWGNPQRNHGISVARGRFIAFMDDDDVYLPYGLRAIRDSLPESPILPMRIFRMVHLGRVIWNVREIERGNVATQMIVIPNVPDRIPKWGEAYWADFEFARDCAKVFDVRWDRSVVAELEANSFGK